MQERMGILENERMKLEQAIDREREERERLENMEKEKEDKDKIGILLQIMSVLGTQSIIKE